MRTLFVFTEINQKFGALGSQHGLMSISAVLKQNGFPNVRSAHVTRPLGVDEWQWTLATYQPHVVGFYSTAEQFHYVRQLIDATPRSTFTICGGPHPTSYPVCLEAVPRLDAVCVGEGEYPMLELLRALQEGRDPTNVPSLWIRRNGSIVKNPVQKFMPDLDSLPFEDRDLFETQRFINQYGMSQLRVMASRGCPYSCTYCSIPKVRTSQDGKFVRARSARHIVDEIKEAGKKFEFNEVVFDDDIFMMFKDVVREFAEIYPREVGKPFVFCAHVEMCNREMLELLKKAGGRRIDFGVESGNPDLRRLILKRRMGNETILAATNLAREIGLQVKTFNMVGLPDETPETFRETVRLNQQINPDVFSLYVFYPYPGTELYDVCVAKGYLDPHESLPENYVSRRQSILRLPKFSKKQINRAFRWAAFHVFRSHSLTKALAYRLIYAQHGELILDFTRKLRKHVRSLLIGF
jgi:radical SAM superfamily enzyme YgiQ (UPF0313 family)